MKVIIIGNQVKLLRVVIKIGENMNFSQKKVIITGAGSGMGRELALQLCKEGAILALLDINKESLNETKRLANNDVNISLFEVNIADYNSLQKFKEDYYKLYDNVDILINNAGIIQPFVNFNELEDEAITRVMNVNFFGLVNLTKMFLPDLLKRPEANLVNISSMGGFFPFPGQTIYGASKAAVKLFTEGLYAELLDSNVSVTLVFPGAIATDIMKNSNVQMKASSNNNSKIKMTLASDAAKQIIAGIRKKKFKVYIGSDSKMMNLMYKFNDKKAIKFIKNKMSQ